MSDGNVLVAKVIANLEGLRAGLSAGKIEIEKTSTQLQNLSASFDGSKLITKASLMVEAVRSVGGASVLTEAEQQKVNRAVDAAIQRYDALGKQAPADMLALRDATAQTAEKSETFLGGVTKLGAALGITFGGAAVIGWVKNLGAEVFNSASQIHDLALKTGTSAEFIQRMGFAAEQSGSNMEAITTAVAKMNATLSEGGTGTIDALKQLGLNFDAIRSMKTEDAFKAITDAIQKVADPMLQAEAAVKLFGKAGQDLLPGIKEGLTETGKQTTVMSNDTVNRLEAAQDAWTKFGHGVTIVSGTIVSSLIGIGEHITSSTANWKMFLDDMLHNGPAVAMANAHYRDSIAGITTELTAAQKVAADFWKKQKDFSIEDAAVMLNVSVPSLKAYYAAAKQGSDDQSANQKKRDQETQDSAKLQLEAWNDTVKRQQQLYKDADAEIARALDLQDQDVQDSAKAQLDDWSETIRRHKEEEKRATDEILGYFDDLDAAAFASAKDQLDSWNAAVRQHRKDESDADREIQQFFRDQQQAHQRMVEGITAEGVILFDGMLHGWESFGNATERVLNDILVYLEKQFVASLVASFAGGTNTMGQMFNGFTNGVSGGSPGSSVTGAGTSAAGNAATTAAKGGGINWANTGASAVATLGVSVIAQGVSSAFEMAKMYPKLKAEQDYINKLKKQIEAFGVDPLAGYMSFNPGVINEKGSKAHYEMQLKELLAGTAHWGYIQGSKRDPNLHPGVFDGRGGGMPIMSAADSAALTRGAATIVVNNNFTIDALDSKSVDDWLRNGGGKQIAEAVTEVADRFHLVTA